MVEIEYDEDSVRRLWQNKIRRSGKVYLSRESLAETDSLMMMKFLQKNDYHIQELADGVYITKNELIN